MRATAREDQAGQDGRRSGRPSVAARGGGPRCRTCSGEARSDKRKPQSSVGAGSVRRCPRAGRPKGSRMTSRTARRPAAAPGSTRRRRGRWVSPESQCWANPGYSGENRPGGAPESPAAWITTTHTTPRRSKTLAGEWTSTLLTPRAGPAGSVASSNPYCSPLSVTPSAGSSGSTETVSPGRPQMLGGSPGHAAGRPPCRRRRSASARAPAAGAPVAAG